MTGAFTGSRHFFALSVLAVDSNRILQVNDRWERRGTCIGLWLSLNCIFASNSRVNIQAKEFRFMIFGSGFNQ